MNITLSIWLLTVALILGLLLFDLLTSTRKAHDVSFKEATFWSVFYIAVAVIFGICHVYNTNVNYENQRVIAELQNKLVLEETLIKMLEEKQKRGWW